MNRNYSIITTLLPYHCNDKPNILFNRMDNYDLNFGAVNES